MDLWDSIEDGGERIGAAQWLGSIKPISAERSSDGGDGVKCDIAELRRGAKQIQGSEFMEYDPDFTVDGPQVKIPIVGRGRGRCREPEAALPTEELRCNKIGLGQADRIRDLSALGRRKHRDAGVQQVGLIEVPRRSWEESRPSGCQVHWVDQEDDGIGASDERGPALTQPRIRQDLTSYIVEYQAAGFMAVPRQAEHHWFDVDFLVVLGLVQWKSLREYSLMVFPLIPEGCLFIRGELDIADVAQSLFSSRIVNKTRQIMALARLWRPDNGDRAEVALV
jgi:hypothetical protein